MNIYLSIYVNMFIELPVRDDETRNNFCNKTSKEVEERKKNRLIYKINGLYNDGLLTYLLHHKKLQHASQILIFKIILRV